MKYQWIIRLSLYIKNVRNMLLPKAKSVEHLQS